MLLMVKELTQVTRMKDRANNLDRARSTLSQTNASPFQSTLTPSAILIANQATSANDEVTSRLDRLDRQEDPLRGGAIRAPLKDMVSAVASVNRADFREGALRSQKPSTSFDASRRKRIRLGSVEPLVPPNSRIPSWRRWSHSHQHLDPITCGIVSESEAERLFGL
jgi:hypothetical protein